MIRSRKISNEKLIFRLLVHMGVDPNVLEA